MRDSIWRVDWGKKRKVVSHQDETVAQPSKAVDWHLAAAQHEIDKLPRLPFPPANLTRLCQAISSIRRLDSKCCRFRSSNDCWWTRETSINGAGYGGLDDSSLRGLGCNAIPYASYRHMESENFDSSSSEATRGKWPVRRPPPSSVPVSQLAHHHYVQGSWATLGLQLRRITDQVLQLSFAEAAQRQWGLLSHGWNLIITSSDSSGCSCKAPRCRKNYGHKWLKCGARMSMVSWDRSGMCFSHYISYHIKISIHISTMRANFILLK